MSKPGAPLSREEEEVRIKQIASLIMGGELSQRQIAKELNLSESTVRRMMQKDSFKETLAALGDEAVAIAKSEMRSVARRLAPKAQRALEELLDADSDRGKAEGLKYFFQLVGVNEHEQNDGGGNITINLPGQRTETVIETTGKEIPDDNV
jgi:hypothetical protein